MLVRMLGRFGTNVGKLFYVSYLLSVDAVTIPSFVDTYYESQCS
jgi:hypothetical protein